jgi:hypothetical protein
MIERDELNRQDQELLQEVERLIANEDGERREADSLYGFCAHLASTRPLADEAFRLRLETKLISVLESEKKERKMSAEQTKNGPLAWFIPARPSLRAALTALLLIVLLAGGLIAVYPPAGAFAKAVFDAVRGQTSQVIVTVVENGTISREEAITTDITGPLTLAEAQAEVDFTIRLPAYLPGGYSLTEFNIYPGSRDMVTILFDTQVDGPGQAREFFELHESKREGIYAGGEPLGDVLINGRTAVWAQDVSTTTDDAGRSSPLTANKLYWEDGGIYFTLRSYDLSQQEMLKIAASIK